MPPPFIHRHSRRTPVANVFGTSWQTVYRSVRYAVMWGIAHEDWSGIDVLLASRPDPLFGKHVQRSFRDLREYLTGNAGV